MSQPGTGPDTPAAPTAFTAARSSRVPPLVHRRRVSAPRRLQAEGNVYRLHDQVPAPTRGVEVVHATAPGLLPAHEPGRDPTGRDVIWDAHAVHGEVRRHGRSPVACGSLR